MALLARALFLALSISSLTLIGCESSFTAACEEAATEQCSLCFACTVDGGEDGLSVSGGTLCRTGTQSSQETCVTSLTEACEEQAAGRQEGDDEIALCNESLEQASCSLIHEAYALDKSYATEACQRFF